VHVGLLLPWRRLVLETAWSPVEAKREIRMWQRARLSARDAALVVSGAVRPSGVGSRVVMTVRLPVPALLFMGVWLGGVVLGGAASIAVALAQRRLEALIFWLIPAGQWAVAGLMTRARFVREARKAEDFLRRLFPPPPPPKMGPFR
jgi:hypothetical protein